MTRQTQVTLFDLSPELLHTIAPRVDETAAQLDHIKRGPATDLQRFPDDTLDAVLLTGPLPHLLEVADRRQALAQVGSKGYL